MAGYQSSKMNAQRWGTSIEGAIQCRRNCPYMVGFETVCCPDGVQHVGRTCLVDLAYEHLYADSMRQEHPLLEEYRPDDFANIVNEAVRVALLRERINARWNHAWSLGSEKWAQMDLCARYWTAMNNRYRDLLARIDQLYDDVHVEIEDQRMRRLALTGHAVPESYRVWAQEAMQEYSRNARECAVSRTVEPSQRTEQAVPEHPALGTPPAPTP